MEGNLFPRAQTSVQFQHRMVIIHSSNLIGYLIFSATLEFFLITSSLFRTGGSTLVDGTIENRSTPLEVVEHFKFLTSDSSWSLRFSSSGTISDAISQECYLCIGWIQLPQLIKDFVLVSTTFYTWWSVCYLFSKMYNIYQNIYTNLYK